jgi:hypothetical protein
MEAGKLAIHLFFFFEYSERIGPIDELSLKSTFRNIRGGELIGQVIMPFGK